MGNQSSICRFVRKSSMTVVVQRILDPVINNLAFRNGTNFEILDSPSILLIQRMMARHCRVSMLSLILFNKTERYGVDTFVDRGSCD